VAIRCARYISAGRNHGMSNLFINCNRNKRSVVLDLKSEPGRDAFLKLAATCDVLLYNVRPQAMRRLRLGYEDVRAVRPDIVYVGGFGFGESGPYAGRPAFDDLIQALTAVPDLVQRAGCPEPRFVPVNFCDRVSGLSLVNTVLAALFHRARTGTGQAVEVPMFETMAQFVLGDQLGGHSFVPPVGPPGYLRLLNPGRKPFAT
jgi:crotonobetainyl-CoA:carnitine CoA-transferase CaiB-like acyl-CoA transferase